MDRVVCDSMILMFDYEEEKEKIVFVIKLTINDFILIINISKS